MSAPVPPDRGLPDALGRVAAADRLLVAVDVDGTIAEIAPRPQDARVLDSARAALQHLAGLDRTVVAVVSGRAYDELASMVDLPGHVVLVGSHGAELGGPVALDPDAAATRARLVALAEELAAQVPGALVEAKPTGAALHVRLAEEAAGEDLLSALRRAAAGLPGVHVRTGKKVLELAVVPTGKDRAVELLRARHAVDAVVYVGDDDTDEDALAVLGPTDVGVRVGPGPTRAGIRVADPAAVVAFLEALADARGRVLATR